MASILQFHNIGPSLTPPPSDRGECEEAAMLSTDAYLPEVFYPSPAPSFSHQRTSFAAQSPDMGNSDSTYDTEEDNQQMFSLNGPQPHIFANTTSLADSSIYSTPIPYQQFEANSWMSFGAYQNGLAIYPYTTEEQTSIYPDYVSEAPSSIIPPIPQTVNGASFNFNEPMSKPQSFANFLHADSSQSIRHHSPRALSITSVSRYSSRSCSPSLHSEPRQKVRPSLMPQRSSSSSLYAYGIAIQTPDSADVQAWRCAFPNCTSRAVFTRGCDLRKHYNRHSKHLFCRIAGCPQSEAACITMAQQQAIQNGSGSSDPSKLAITGGFSSKKDRARHEAKHNPGIKCEWKGSSGEECGRLFSRMDNMKDHVRRIHNKGLPQAQTQTNDRKKSVQ